MIKYKRVDAPNGRTMYFKNGKMISKNSLSPSLLGSLEDGVELTLPTPDPGATPSVETLDETVANEPELPQSKNCIFCGEPATRTTFVNLQTANLCQEDKVSHTLGEIAEQLRKNAESHDPIEEQPNSIQP